ncbi:hypothetical protein ACFFIS_12290 [Virgibacillus soli]|uniref:Uncharacterized protein n=1 Tax=Paracerasibacillus soli TaxID=480284 RepID=A0ABU5CNU6_9BACI|nr:hypothetical protein [Virgibacillus soli]MDY0408028.1 hypothetical protein [Virgibacillus soli]
MKIFIWISMILMFFYAVHFTTELWKSKSKVGAIVVGILALTIITTPFLSVLK